MYCVLSMIRTLIGNFFVIQLDLKWLRFVFPKKDKEVSLEWYKNMKIKRQRTLEQPISTWIIFFNGAIVSSNHYTIGKKTEKLWERKVVEISKDYHLPFLTRIF